MFCKPHDLEKSRNDNWAKLHFRMTFRADFDVINAKSLGYKGDNLPLISTKRTFLRKVGFAFTRSTLTSTTELASQKINDCTYLSNLRLVF